MPFLHAMIRALLGLLLALHAASAVAATSINGVWSSSSGDYLLMLEASNGSVLVMRVNASLSGGTVFLGSRSGDNLSVKTLDASQSLALAVSGSSYSGSQSSATGSQSLSGNLLFAYSGSVYDGVWQRTGASDR
jgi:hypothetical protein